MKTIDLKLRTSWGASFIRFTERCKGLRIHLPGCIQITVFPTIIPDSGRPTRKAPNKAV